MPQKSKYPSDRWLTIEDERKRIIPYENWQLELPTPHIFDAPLRCYQVNEEWAKLITGAVSILLEIGVWKDANEDDYSGILQVQEFLEGQECMDCNDVQACMQAIIDGLQAQITTNANNITTLTNQYNDHENRITQIETVDIPEINLNIDDLNDRVTSIETVDIPQINLTLTNHENRITALEQSGGAGGAGIKTTTLTIPVETDVSTQSLSFVEDASLKINHIFTLPNALVVMELRGQNTGTNPYATVRMRVGTYIGVTENRIKGAHAYNSTQLSETIIGVEAGSQEIAVQFKTSATTATIAAPQDIMISIIEYGQAVQPPTDYLIDFTASGWGWIDNNPFMTGQFSATGGNPDECYIDQSMSQNSLIAIKAVNIEETVIYNLKMDVFLSYLENNCYIKINGVTVGGAAIQVTTLNQWVTLDFAAQFPASFPIIHNPSHTIEFFIQGVFGANGEGRMDNLLIDVTE